MHKANLTKFAALKAQAKALEASIKALQVKIISDMDNEGIESITHNGHMFTVVPGSARLNVTVASLKASLEPETLALVTKVTVDNEALKAALKSGLVPKSAVSYGEPSKSYVRVS